LDEISGDAERIAAVNTISVRDGRLFGENTDWQGFLSDLDQIGFRPHGSNALILGSGGAARAVVYALVARGCSVTVAGRNPLTVKAIIDHMQRCFARSSVDGMDPGRLTELKRPFELVVNTTPVGMYPRVHDTPWPESLPFPRCSLAYDLIYNPFITSFMRQAAGEGIQAVNGLGMLVQQAAAAFTIWTGREAPLQIMCNAALRGLKC